MQKKKRNILGRAIRKARFLSGYLRSHVSGQINKDKYRDLRCFLVFVGYPRSGHTLVASLLDAHPNIMISIEWGALSHLRMGYGKNAILYAVEKHSRLFTDKLRNVWTGYSYRVENQWQGRSGRIEVIGDKLAGQTSKILKEYPDLLDRLHKEMGLEIKIIHVIRNPFDTITTIAHRALEKGSVPGDEPDLSRFSQQYFERVEVVQSLRKQAVYSMFDVYHEDFIRDPKQKLSDMLDYIGIGFDDSYLTSCSEVVYESPHQSRKKYHWPEDIKELVQSQIARYDFLNRYTFND